MYKATQDFKSYAHGQIKKGEAAPFKQDWLDAGLIEEGKPDPVIETKPAPKKKKEIK